MAQVITLAGEKLFATKAQANQQLDIDTFIFANVAGQDPAAAIDRNEGIPTSAIVHQQNVQQTGRINDNVVVYSTVLDSVTGPFEFNWVGLYSSVNQTLVAISHVPKVSKTITAPGSAGNTLNRNFGIEYSGIADLAGISVSPETWQLDFSARLSGMDELTRQLASDMNGKDWFIDDGFKVVPRSTANTFSVTPGVGYVSGLRVELKQEHILTLQTYPQFVYVDAYFDGNASSQWKPQVAFTVSNTEMDDYIDVNGIEHYVYKIAVISGANVVDDLRVDLSTVNLDIRYQLLAENLTQVKKRKLIGDKKLNLIAGQKYIVKTIEPKEEFIISEHVNTKPTPHLIDGTDFYAQKLSDKAPCILFIFDDGTSQTKQTLMPLAIDLGIKAGIALYYSGMAASNDNVSIKDAYEFNLKSGGEVLSHSMNSEKLDDQVDKYYGSELIRTSADIFRQFGFSARGFVAPNSILSSKFNEALIESYDFAFTRSVALTDPYNGLNFPWDNLYSLVRIGLESITTEKAKEFIDAAAKTGAMICFYTHTNTGNLEELINYSRLKGIDNLSPTEWVKTIKGVNSSFKVEPTTNYLINSEMRELSSGDGPYKWAISMSGIVDGSYRIREDGQGNSLDFTSSINTKKDEFITFSQNWFVGSIKEITPICFSLFGTSLKETNTKIKLTLSLKDSDGSTIKNISKEQIISTGRQRIFLADSFNPSGSAKYVVAECKILAIDDGAIRFIMDSPQLEMSGKPTVYKGTNINEKYYSSHRVTSNQQVPTNTEKTIIFNQNYEGANFLYKNDTGTLAPLDGRVYLLNAEVGLKGMAAGDEVEIFLFVDGVKLKKNQFIAKEGDNIFGASFSVRGDGRAYAIGIQHNSELTKQLTTYSDAILTITG